MGLMEGPAQIFTTANDSAMVYLPGLEDWVELDLTDQFDPISSSVPFCEWGNGNSFRPDLVVEMAGDTAGIQVGYSLDSLQTGGIRNLPGRGSVVAREKGRKRREL